MTSLYMNKYILALYDEDDHIVDVFDNCHQLAEWLNKTVASTMCSVGRCIKGIIEHIICRGEKYKVYAIEVED